RYWWPSAMLAAVYTLFLIASWRGPVAPWVQWSFGLLCVAVGFLNIPTIPIILVLRYCGVASPWVAGGLFLGLLVWTYSSRGVADNPAAGTLHKGNQPAQRSDSAALR